MQHGQDMRSLLFMFPRCGRHAPYNRWDKCAAPPCICRDSDCMQAMMLCARAKKARGGGQSRPEIDT